MKHLFLVRRSWQMVALVCAMGSGLLTVGGSALGEDPPGMDVRVNVNNEVPVAERSSWLVSQTESAKGIYRRVQNMLDNARREKDTIKITCLDDKLTQISVSLRGIEERSAAFEAANQSGDKSAADQQFTVLSIYLQRVRGLASEAENCIGDSDTVLGESETTMTVDENITVENPAGEKQDIYQQVGTEQLPHASGYY